MKIDIWSDVVCPFCYIGKRRLEAALEAFPHRDEVEVVWHSYELDPTSAAVVDADLVDLLASKYGMTRERAQANQDNLTQTAAAEGLDFHFERARHGNTFDAHRLIHLAAENGLGDATKERFLRGYFTEGAAIGDHATLTRLAVEAGLDEAAVTRVLGSDEYAQAVRADEQRGHDLGIQGVPFFVIDDTLGISGAQPTELFSRALTQAWDTAHPLQMVPTDGGGACDGDSCAV